MCAAYTTVLGKVIEVTFASFSSAMVYYHSLYRPTSPLSPPFPRGHLHHPPYDAAGARQYQLPLQALLYP